MKTLLLLVLGALAARTDSSSSVTSPDGRFVATSREGEVLVERVTHEGARELAWKAAHACDAGPAAHFLADGGRAFAHVEARVAEGRAPVVVLVPEAEPLSIDAAALDLDAGAGEWIELSARSLRFGRAGATGPPEELDLLGRDGRLRQIDLASGRVDVPRTDAAALDVTPSALPEGGALMIVGSWTIPPVIAAGGKLPIEVVLRIPAPRPGKLIPAFAGFQVLPRAEGLVEVLPLGRMTTTEAREAHASRVIGNLSGLAPGRHRILVDGVKASSGVRPPQDVLVLPGERRVALATSGGILGQRRRVELWSNGVWIDTGLRGEALDVGLAPLAAWDAIERALAALPGAEALPEVVPPTEGADFVRCDLTWSDATGPRRAVRDDGTLAEPLLGVVRLLNELAMPPDPAHAPAGSTAPPEPEQGARMADPATSSGAAVVPAPAPRPAAPRVERWPIEAKASRLAVHTRAAGLLSAFGHDHTLEPRAFSGFVELVDGRVGEARLELSVDARSLAVTNRESRDDAAEIEENTRAKVLESERHPAITFTSTRVEAQPLGTKGAWKVALHGELSMHGRKRAIVVPGTVTIEDGTLRARGELELAMSDWKVKAPSAAVGTVKVADKFGLTFDLVAREPR